MLLVICQVIFVETIGSHLNLNIPGYAFEFVPTPLVSGGVGMYINNKLRYSVLERTTNQSFQALWIDIHFENKKNIICGIFIDNIIHPKLFFHTLKTPLKNTLSRKSLYLFLGISIQIFLNQRRATLVMNFYFLYKVSIFFLQLINQQEFITTRQPLLTSFLRTIVNVLFLVGT